MSYPFSGYGQQDCSEFSIYLFDKFEEEFKKDGKANIVNQYFWGNFKKEIKWDAWENISSSSEEFNHISLNIDNVHESIQHEGDLYSVQNLFDNFFVPEDLSYENNNQYECSKCECKVEKAWWTYKLSSNLPPYLIVTLKRFSYNPEKGINQKLKQIVDISERIMVSRIFIIQWYRLKVIW